MFLQVSVCPHRGGVVLFGGGHAWFYPGGMRGFIRGACVVLFGGACMVLFGEHAWFYLFGGGMRGFIWGGVCGFIWGGGMHGFFSFFGYNEIRINERALRILLECILVQYASHGYPTCYQVAVRDY